MPEQVNVFALFNTLKRDGAARLSDCTVNKVGESVNAAAGNQESAELKKED